MRKHHHLHPFRILLAVALLALAGGCGRRKEVQQVPLGEVAHGTFIVDMYEEGELEAVNSINISSPSISWRYGNLKITEIIKDGEEVNAGDTAVVFDPLEVQRGIIEAESRLEISEAELEKLLAQHLSELEELRADYEVTRISQEISKIRFEQAGYESDIKKKEIQLNLEKADIALERAREQIDNRIRIQKEEVRQKELSIEQDRGRLREAHETLGKLSVVAPSPGIAIIARNWSSQNKYQVGDQCWSGTALIQLPDLSSLKATVRINEVDISKITKGLDVEIKPDAFSDSLFTGRVYAVANLAVNKDNSSKIKVFPVEIRINETHPNLLPGLTVSCRLIIDKLEDVLYVPLEAVHTEGDKSFVYKKAGSGYDKLEVVTGAVNADFIVIQEGLKAGDSIALVDPYYKPGQTEDQSAKGEGA